RVFLSHHTVTPQINPLSLHDALPIFDNTAQYTWFLEIARTFLGFKGERVGEADCDALCDAADRFMTQSDWEQQVLTRTNVEKILDRKSTRLNSSHQIISYAVFCLQQK